MLSKAIRASSRPTRFTSPPLRTRRPSSASTLHRESESESAHPAFPGPGTESLGKGFYIVLSLLPLSLVAGTLMSSTDTSARITRFIQSLTERRDQLDQRNALHQAAAEQAAFDRHLFSTAAPGGCGVELRFPEAMNRSSPWNVVPGDHADLRQLMEHYARENGRAEEERLARIQRNGGRITTVYDDTTGGRFPSWVPLIGGSKKVRPGFRE